MQASNGFNLVQAVTLAIAVLGAVLGVINTWRSINNDRVRLKVTPVEIFVPEFNYGHFGIEVINLSGFNVTVTHIGFTLGGTSNYLHVFPDERLGKSVPHVFEARTSATFHITASAADLNDFDLVKKAFVKTACGLTIYGSSKALVSYKAKVASARALLFGE